MLPVINIVVKYFFPRFTTLQSCGFIFLYSVLIRCDLLSCVLKRKTVSLEIVILYRFDAVYSTFQDYSIFHLLCT